MSGLSSTSTSPDSTTYGTNVPPISFPGIASGIDYNSIINKYSSLTVQQSAPLKQKVTQLNAAQAELLKIQNLLQTFQNSFQAVSNPALFNATTATSTATGVVSLSNVPNSTATPGSTTIQSTTLATATQIVSDPAANGNISLTSPLVSAGFQITPQDGTSNGTVVPATLTIDGVSLSFDVNSATLNSVVATINGNATLNADGVTASVDPTTGNITITQSTTTQPLTIGAAGDTGNLLQAFKLDTAQIQSTGGPPATGYTVTSSGRVAGINLGATFTPAAAAGYATAVTSGSFTINGVQIAVNASTQNLNNILTAINNSTAGVVASYNSATGQVALTNKNTGAQGVQLGSSTDSSNFLQAVGILANYQSPGTLSAHATETVGAPASVTYLNAQNQPVTVYSSSNDVTNVIPGVDIKLQQSTSTQFAINVGQDSSGLQTAINTFVTSYNAVINEINTATQPPVVGSTTDSSTGQQVSGQLTGGGVLANNQDVLMLKDDLVGMLGQLAPNTGSSAYNSLASIGLQFDSSFQVSTAGAATDSSNSSDQTSVNTTTYQGTSGALQPLNVSTLTAALAANPNAVAALFTGASSIIGQVGTYLTSATGLPTMLTSGLAGSVPSISLFNEWTQTTSDQISSLQEQIQLVTDQANAQADQLRAQFADSEGQIAQLQSLQSSLAGFFKSSSG